MVQQHITYRRDWGKGCGGLQLNPAAAAGEVREGQGIQLTTMRARNYWVLGHALSRSSRHHRQGVVAQQQ